MNLKTNSILAAIALAVTTTAQAGPGPRDPGVITPRPILTREVTMSCSRCQQPVPTTAQRIPKSTKKYVATTATVAVQKAM